MRPSEQFAALRKSCTLTGIVSYAASSQPPSRQPAPRATIAGERESRKLRKQSPANAAWKAAALARCKIDAHYCDDSCIRMFERRRPPNRVAHRHDPAKSSYVPPMLLQFPGGGV